MLNSNNSLLQKTPKRNLCPKCGADIDRIKEMLREPRGTDNHDTACFMLLNCKGCHQAVTKR